jgi:4-alpha-glucanotransferase
MLDRKKIIGTFVPISALSSSRLSPKDHGTFAVGIPFLNWLVKTKQSGWQMLPLHETHLEPNSIHTHVPSPYKGYGVGFSPQYLSSSFANKTPSEQEFTAFVDFHHEWLSDYALFCALRDYFGTDDWRKWDADIRSYTVEARVFWQEQLVSEIKQHMLMQWRLHREYEILRQKATELGIALIGDIAFYLPLQSPLVWAHQELFQFEKDGSMSVVSGYPNTPVAHFGRQIWGHPLYKWNGKGQIEALFKLWEIRVRYLSGLFDYLRFDHTKAFFQYGVMDIEHQQHDRWRRGPGKVFFASLIDFSKAHGLKVFAEDSGDHVRELRTVLGELHVPGMSLLRFAFDEKFGKINKRYGIIARYPEECVAYTTTHDTETLLRYLELLTPKQKQKLATNAQVDYSVDDRVFAKRIREAIIASPAALVIIPIQDWLLTTDRINIPGTEKAVGDTNWQYRLSMPVEDLPQEIMI